MVEAPLNYLLVAGEPQDLDIQHPGYWTMRPGSHDDRYSRGAIQFHPFRYGQKPDINREFDIRLIRERFDEIWFHASLKAFPYDAKERGQYPILTMGDISLELAYFNSSQSDLMFRDGDASLKVATVSVKEIFEIDIRITNSSTEFYLNGEKVRSTLGERSLPTSASFKSSKRDMIYWSQIIVADQSTIGCKLSTIVPETKEESSAWRGEVHYVNEGEISDHRGITITDNGDIIFGCKSKVDEPTLNFIDCVVLSARLNTVKEERNISANYSDGDVTVDEESSLNKFQYLKNSQVSMRLNRIRNDIWRYHDLKEIRLGLSATSPD